MKFVVLAVVIALVWWVLLRRPRDGGRGRKGRAPPAAPTAFLVCANCGVHLPATDAVKDGALAYCSDAHRLAGPSDPGRR